jgi:hypothetical protein
VLAVACSQGTGGSSVPVPASPPPVPTTVATSSSTAVSSSATVTTAVAPTGPCGESGPAPARYDHVVWIWMENHSASAVLGPRAATPFEKDLAARCGSGTNYHAVGSPSLPNYLGATSGSSQGVHDDASPSSHRVDADNLFRQVRAAQESARSYEEAMTQNCQPRPAGRYAVKHNPQAYYVGAEDLAACQRDDVPLGSLTAGRLVDDLDRGQLPAFSFITPDLCDDTHDCGVDLGDAWLSQWVGRLLDSAVYRAGRTALFVVWDEPTPMPVLVVSPTTPSGTTSPAPFDHYSLLRTTEELLGLPYLGQAATATSMRPAFGL